MSAEIAIITFRASHAAMRAERELAVRGYAVELVPVPREISSDCGFCLRASLEGGEASRARALGLAAALSCEGAWAERATETADGRREKRYERIA